MRHKLTLKDMRTTLRVLETLDVDVPNRLMVEISARIREEEARRDTRRMNRMSEEQLIAYEGKKRTSLRVNLSDGRLLYYRTNDLTFHAVLREIGIERLQLVTIFIKHHPLFLFDDQLTRKRQTGYALVMPGLFVYRKTTSQEKYHALLQLDEALQLGMEVELR